MDDRDRGSGLAALAAGLTGWLLMKTTWLERVLLVAAGLVLVYPSLVQDLIGLGLFAFAATLQYPCIGARRLIGCLRRIIEIYPAGIDTCGWGGIISGLV